MTLENIIYRYGKKIEINKDGLDYLVSLEAKLNMVRDLVMNSDKYDDSDFEGCVFQNDILDIIGGDINDR